MEWSGVGWSGIRKNGRAWDEVGYGGDMVKRGGFLWVGGWCGMVWDAVGWDGKGWGRIRRYGVVWCDMVWYGMDYVAWRRRGVVSVVQYDVSWYDVV